MADSQVNITQGVGTSIDTRTETGGQHRQVIVLGDPSSTDAVAAVQATDPASNTEGLVVRDVNGSAIVAAINNISISTINRVNNVVDGTLTTVTGVDRVRNIVDGTISLVSAVTNITNSIAVHVLSTGGTLQVQNLTTGTVAISAKDGTFAVSFSPGTPAVLPIGSQANTPFRTNTDGALKIYDIVTGTINAVTGITNSIAVHVLSTNGTMGVDVGKVQQVDFVTRVRNVVDGTLTTVTGVDRVRNVVDGTLTTVTGVDRVRNVVDGTLSLVTMVQRVNNVVDGTIKLSSSSASIAVYFDRGNPAVNNYFNGNVAVTPNAGIPAVNIYATTGIFTVSGSTSGGTTSGVTLISPSANYNFKIFAFSIQTTALAANVWRFCNGSGASQTEFWRALTTEASTTSSPKGSNMAISPPGYLFATGTSTTLVLHSDAGSLVHYSVSYIKESA